MIGNAPPQIDPLQSVTDVLLHELATSSIVEWQGRPGWQGQAYEPWRDFDFMGLPWLDLIRPRRRRDGTVCIKISRSRHVLRVGHPEGHGSSHTAPVYAKRYLINSSRRRFGNSLTGGKASREFRIGTKLIRLGFQTPWPLAYATATRHRIFGPPAERGFTPAASFLLTLNPYFPYEQSEVMV